MSEDAWVAGDLSGIPIVSVQRVEVRRGTGVLHDLGPREILDNHEFAPRPNRDPLSERHPWSRA